MKTIVVASHNPVKLNAVKMAFISMFPDETFTFEAYSIPSGVSDQPMTLDETRQGSINRAKNAKEQYPQAHYWVGLEGGLHSTVDGLANVAYMSIINHKDQISTTHSASFTLPPIVAEHVYNGKELGDAMDAVFNQKNSKQKQGATAILTHGVMNRTDYYIAPLTTALIPFVNPQLYPCNTK